MTVKRPTSGGGLIAPHRHGAVSAPTTPAVPHSPTGQPKGVAAGVGRATPCTGLKPQLTSAITTTTPTTPSLSAETKKVIELRDSYFITQPIALILERMTFNGALIFRLLELELGVNPW